MAQARDRNSSLSIYSKRWMNIECRSSFRCLQYTMSSRLTRHDKRLISRAFPNVSAMREPELLRFEFGLHVWKSRVKLAEWASEMQAYNTGRLRTLSAMAIIGRATSKRMLGRSVQTRWQRWQNCCVVETPRRVSPRISA